MSSHAISVNQAGLITLGEQIEAVRRAGGRSWAVRRVRGMLTHPMGRPATAWRREPLAPTTAGSPDSTDLTEAIPSTAVPAAIGPAAIGPSASAAIPSVAGPSTAARAGTARVTTEPDAAGRPADRATGPLTVGEVSVGEVTVGEVAVGEVAGSGSAARGSVNGSVGGRVDGQAPGPGDDEKVALVARARRGDRDAFGQLYDRYADLVFRYALYRVSGDPVAAEDIVSETFLRAFRTITDFRWQGRDIGAWFITIARNLLVDQARSARSRFEFPTADILAAADRRDAAAAVPGPEESVLAVATRRELWEAVRGLRPDQQECVALRFLEGLSVRETALAMGRNEGAVRALQFRAIRTLARSLPALDPG